MSAEYRGGPLDGGVAEGEMTDLRSEMGLCIDAATPLRGHGVYVNVRHCHDCQRRAYVYCLVRQGVTS